MDTNQTTASGATLTMITGVGGEPVTRATVERFCNERHQQTDLDRKHGATA